MTAVRLHLAAVDLTADDIVERIASNETLRALSWKNISGTTIMTVHTDGDVVADTIAAVRCAQNAGFKVMRVYEDRPNIGEITRRLGNPSREAVRKWTADPTFPAHRFVQNGDGARGASPSYDWAEVVAWLQKNKSLMLDEDLPTERQVAEINAALCGVRDYASDDVHRHLFTHETHGQVSVYRADFSHFASLTLRTAGWATYTSKHAHPRVDEIAAEREYA